VADVYKQLAWRDLRPAPLYIRGGSMQTENVKTENAAGPVVLTTVAAQEVRRYIEEQGAG